MVKSVMRFGEYDVEGLQPNHPAWQPEVGVRPLMNLKVSKENHVML